MTHRLFAAALTAASILALPAAVHATVLAAPHARNVVLVHGAFADASGWDKVADILRHKGYHVTEVANPLTSLADDVAATQAVLKAQKGPTVLVGHSWGGVVIGEAGNDPKVKSLVYIAAFAPDAGESIATLSAGSEPTEGLKTVRPDARGYLSVDPAAYPTVFAGDVPQAEAEAMAAKQIPVNSQALGAVSQVAAWHLKPSWYAISSEDKMIDPKVEAFFAQRIKATTVTLKASHASMVSQPQAVADLIEQAAQ